MTSRADRLARVNAGIALAVAVGAGLAPGVFLRLFGVRRSELTGAGAFGWRLFAARNLVVGARALRGDEAARDLFLPLQAIDQTVFVHAYRSRSVPAGGAALAMAISGLIVVLDLVRRLEGRASSAKTPRAVDGSGPLVLR